MTEARKMTPATRLDNISREPFRADFPNNGLQSQYRQSQTKLDGWFGRREGTQMEFTSMSLRCHSDVTSIPLGSHSDLTSISLRSHFDLTSTSFRVFAPSSIRLHVDLRSESLRSDFDLTPILCRIHSVLFHSLTSMSLRSTSVSLR